MKRVAAKSHWKLALDKLVRKIVIARDRTCRRCGKWREGEGPGFGMQAAHIYGKGAHPAMRFDTRNVLLLCQPCHFWWHTKGFGREAAMRNEVRDWCVATLGVALMHTLDLMALTTNGQKGPDRELIKLQLQLEAKKLGVEV